MSREEANQIIKIKEERKAARLAAKNQENMNSVTSTGVIAVGPIKSVYSKDEDASSSGNNSGNDSHEEGEKRSTTTSLRRTNSSVAIESTTTLIQEKSGSSAVETPGYRELLSTRARVDNGFVSGKGQGKAL